ncbi:MAG TPA: FAD-linked oxidase C-terminal domain-containing protein [Tepidisphaeraceae bacterium]|nr:FAD-linked oxidase C-terminal domain-containing protein [Tepidisphaeraceae bacterium]
MNKETLIKELLAFLPPDRVRTDPAELFVYESDGFTIAKARPAGVVFPDNTDQVVRIVGLLAKHGAQIVPRGSGTGLTGGCVAFDNGVIVSTAKMNRILKIDLPNRVAHVEAGVRNTQLSDAVALLPGGAAYHFSPDPSSQRASSIGGNASTNAGGIHVLKDFVTSNHILGMEMVLADGSVINVGAQNGCYEAGFDLPGLICGSEGTFGIITKLWVRLIPKARSFRTIVGIFSTTNDACNTVSRVVSEGHLPAAMEMMDGMMVQVVNNAFDMGFPKDAQALILAEIDGVDELLDAQMHEIETIMRNNNAMSIQSSSDPDTRTKLWKARKQAFGAVGRISPSYCTQDACVPRSMLPQVLQRIGEIAREHGLVVTNVFHAGDGNIHPLFLYDDQIEEQVQNTLHAAERMLEYCIDIGGTLTGEHGVGVEKIGLMPYMFDSPTMALFQRIKRAFDPEEQINAGKLLPSDKLKVQLLNPGRHVPQ